MMFMTEKKGQIYKTLANEEMSEIILSTLIDQTMVLCTAVVFIARS